MHDDTIQRKRITIRNVDDVLAEAFSRACASRGITLGEGFDSAARQWMKAHPIPKQWELKFPKSKSKPSLWSMIMLKGLKCFGLAPRHRLGRPKGSKNKPKVTTPTLFDNQPSNQNT